MRSLVGLLGLKIAGLNVSPATGRGQRYNTPFRNAPAAGALRVHTSAEPMFPLRLILRMKLLVIVAVESPGEVSILRAEGQSVFSGT